MCHQGAGLVVFFFFIVGVCCSTINCGTKEEGQDYDESKLGVEKWTRARVRRKVAPTAEHCTYRGRGVKEEED